MGATPILQKMNKNMRICNLNRNKIGKSGAEVISKIICAQDSNLQELYIESNK